MKPPQGYGLPLTCPKCPEKGDYFGMLKIPGNKAVPCPNCGTHLEATRKRRSAPHMVEGERGTAT